MADMPPKERVLEIVRRERFRARDIEDIFRALMSNVGRGRRAGDVCPKRGHPMTPENTRIERRKTASGVVKEYRGGCKLCSRIDGKVSKATR